MGASKQSVFDSATPANGDTIASYLYAATGEAFTVSSLVSDAVKALDVKAFLSDIAGNGITSTSGALNVNISSFSASGFDIEGNVADNAADGSTKPVKVGFLALGASPTAATSGNRVNGTADLYRRQFVNTSADIALGHGNASVTDEAAIIVAASAGRRVIMIQNNGDHPIYVGGATVTADQASTGGWIVSAHGGYLEVELGQHVELWGVAAVAGPQKVAYLQLA